MDVIQYVKDILLSLKSELVRFRAMAAALFTVIFLAVLYVSLNWPKYYVSEAYIIRDVTNVIEPLLRGAAQVAQLDKNERVQDIVLSRRMLERAVHRLNPEATSWAPERLEQEVMRLRRNLSVTNDARNRNVTALSYQASTSDYAYEALTAVVDVFIEDRMAEKQKVSFEAHSFITDQVNRYKRRLERAEEKLKEFRARNVDANEQVVKARIAELNNQIQNLRIAIQESEEKIRTTTTQISQESLNATSRARMRTLMDRRAVLAEQLDQLRLIYQDNYPDIVTLRSQIHEIDLSIGDIGLDPASITQRADAPLLEELRKQLSLAEVDLRTQRRRMASLENLLEEEMRVAERVAANQAELMNLTRDYNVTQRTYEEMLVRQESSNLTLALNDEGQGESYRVLEPPTYPLSPAGIPALLIFMAAPLVALAAPIGLALVFVMLDPRLRSIVSLSQKLPEGVHLLGVVPHRGSTLSSRLFRKDMVLLFLLAIILAVVYGYTFYEFGDLL